MMSARWEEAEPDDGFAKRPGMRFKGERLTLEVHDIEGAWFLSCRALNLDCVRLDASTLEEAKSKARRIAKNVCAGYRRDLAVAWFDLPGMILDVSDARSLEVR